MNVERNGKRKIGEVMDILKSDMKIAGRNGREADV